MNEKIYAVLYVLLEIANSFLVYQCLLRVGTAEVRAKQRLSLSFLFLAGIAAVHCADNGDLLDMIAAAGVFVMTLTWTTLSIRNAILICPLVYIGAAIVNTFGSFLIAWLRGCYQSEIIRSHVWTLISECTGIIVCLGYYFLTRKKAGRTTFRIDAKKYVFLWIGVLGCGFMIAAVQSQEQGTALRPEQLKLVGALGSAFGVVFLCICIWQIYTYNSREQTEKENKLYENYLRMQERYTHTLIDADRNMRKFRHDFRAHALAIKGHAQETHDAWLLAYIDEMIDASETKNEVRYTKIAAVDAVIHEMVCTAEKEGIHVEWNGTLGAAGSIRIYDLCTIISNLFLNAVEACRMVETERTIRAEAYRYEKSVYIKMINSVGTSEPKVAAGRLKSKKGDAKNHGLGLENVRKAVELYQGTLTYDFDGAYCTVEVLLFEQ